MTGTLLSVERIADLETLVGDGTSIECECMLCHLPLAQEHGPVRWRVVVHFPGPYPRPGDVAMLLCEECKTDWTENTNDYPGDMSVARVHPV